MTVYVDDGFCGPPGSWGRWTGGGHMQADTEEELHEFAQSIGLKRSWFQTKPNRPDHDHYDLTSSKRTRAIAMGAVEETWREAAKRRHGKPSKRCIIYTDGGCRRKTDVSAIACTMWFPQTGRRINVKQAFPFYKTSNVTEYEAVAMALRKAIKHGVTHLTIRSDSQLIVNQIQGRWRCLEFHLEVYVQQIRALADNFEEIDIEWVRREKNVKADALVNKAMNELALKV